MRELREKKERQECIDERGVSQTRPGGAEPRKDSGLYAEGGRAFLWNPKRKCGSGLMCLHRVPVLWVDSAGARVDKGEEVSLVEKDRRWVWFYM